MKTLRTFLFAALVLCGLAGGAEATDWRAYPMALNAAQLASGLGNLTSDISTTQDIYVRRIYLTADGGFNTPVITRSDDTDTGISWGAANELNFNSGNGTTMTLLNGGNLRIWNNVSIGNGNNGPTSGFDLDVGGILGMRGAISIASGTAVLPSPTVALHITSGTVVPGPCTTNLVCGTVQAGAICMASNTTPYICNGANSWKPISTGAAVSASGVF